MAKYDAVDQLMNLAADKASPGKDDRKDEAQTDLNEFAAAEPATTGSTGAEPGHTAAEREAMDVLAAKVSATEPQLKEPALRSAGLAVPRVTPGDRGRQLLGALRPFLPVVGGALRMIDHGAVQAVARLLPLLGSAPLPGSGHATAAGPASAAEGQQALTDLLTAFDKREAATAEEIKSQGTRLSAAEDQLRRMRETVERMVVEEGAQSNRLREVTDRARLLTAFVTILFMLAIAEMVLLVIYLHR